MAPIKFSLPLRRCLGHSDFRIIAFRAAKALLLVLIVSKEGFL